MTTQPIAVAKLLEDLREGRYVMPSWEHEEFSQDQINEFVERIFGIPWALISARSTISDFCEGPWPFKDEPKPDYWVTVPEAYERINAEYGAALTPETHPFMVGVLKEIYCSKGER